MKSLPQPSKELVQSRGQINSLAEQGNPVFQVVHQSISGCYGRSVGVASAATDTALAGMKERPILFSAPMVRAIQRVIDPKSQTRRIVKFPDWMQPIPDVFVRDLADGKEVWYVPEGADPSKVFRCPCGQPGDRLWVRENFSGPHYQSKNSPSQWSDSDPIWYWADGEPESGDWTKPKPSIHMPRWASRITLEILGVRVERLNDISEADAIAEGIGSIVVSDGGESRWINYADEHSKSNAFGDARRSYRSLWEKINGAGSWAANPWVWVVEFRRTT